MRTLDNLKKLAVKVTSAANEAAVTGDTIDEVISYMENNLKVTANGLVLKDTNDVVYDVTVSTEGALVVTARQ